MVRDNPWMLMVPTSTSASVFKEHFFQKLMKFNDSAVQVFSLSLSFAGDHFLFVFFCPLFFFLSWSRRLNQKGGAKGAGRVAFSRSRMRGLTFRRPFRSLKSADVALGVFRATTTPPPRPPNLFVAVARRSSPAAPMKMSSCCGPQRSGPAGGP